MKILHLSDGKLPDQRVERAALSAAHRNHEVVFVGGRPIEGQIFNVIKNTYIRPWGQQEKIGIPLSLRARTKWLRQILLEEEPDLIHAHDIFAGKLALDSGYPFVYDDHEYWGVRIKYQGTQIMQPRREPTRRLIIRFAIHNWKIWESQVIHNAPCITVSEEVGEIYRKIQPHTYVIPNVPPRNEINMIPPNKNIDTEFRIAYISKGRAPLHDRRDGAALSLWQRKSMNAKLVFVGHELLKGKYVENHGYLPHNEMLSHISDCDIGLIGSRMNFPHLSIQNKFALFMHTGLKTIVPSTQIVMSRFCRKHNVGWVWHNPQNLWETIQRLGIEYQNNPRKYNQDKKRVREIANKFLVWENYEDRLYKAYDAVLANS